MELLVEVLLEFLLQFCSELFADQMFRRVASSRYGTRFILYSIVGALLGGLSLLVFSHHLMGGLPLRLTALGINPVLAGLLMTGLGRWRKNRADTPFGLEAFWPAWGFAFCFGCVRVLFAR